jgi:hypothetical protein
MLTGGELLGSGVYGCAWMPPLECEKGTEITIPSNSKKGAYKKVDKLLSLKNAETEFKISKLIHEIPMWEDYFAVPDTLCKPAVIQKEKELDDCEIITGKDISHLRILRMNYGGEPVDTYKLKEVQSFDFRNFVTTALEAVTLLLLNSLCHMDLHSGNVLLDDNQNAHFIDWNLAIDAKNEPDLEGRLLHSYSLKLTQESPDYLLMNAKFRRMYEARTGIPSEAKIVEDMLDQKPILKKIRSVLGVGRQEQRNGIQAFIRGSRAYVQGDISAWFKTHWHLNDSWAIASMIVGMIGRLSLWPHYTFPEEFAGPDSLGYTVLRKMCRTNPFDRHDAVRGLAELYPGNQIIKAYAAAWLAPHPA